MTMWGGGSNGAGGALIAASAVPESVCEFPLETSYKDMPAPYKAEIDRTWKDMKHPMKQKLSEISRSRGQVFQEVHGELRKIYLAVLKVENEQQRLQAEIKPFLAELKVTSEVGRLQAAIGLQQIRNQSMGITTTSGGGSSNAMNYLTNGSSSSSSSAVATFDENLPCQWYHLVAQQLSDRLNRCIETVHIYERQLATRLMHIEQQNQQLRQMGLNKSNSASNSSSNRGTYGQLQKVGTQELVALMQEQAK
jgi:hypothetical protein